MARQLDYQAVTALFDIDRESYDGRDIHTYLKWLSELIGFFPGIIIYHDKSIQQNFIQSHSTAKFIRMPVSNVLKIDQSKIEAINKTYLIKGASDLVYRSTKYSCLIHSKINLLSDALAHTDSQKLLWIDAGYSRFITNQNLASQLFTAKTFDSNFLLSIDVKNLFKTILKRKTVKIASLAQVGTSTRIVGAATIMISRKYVDSIKLELLNLQNFWIKSKIWDTEQVALLHILKKTKPYLVPEVNNNLDIFVNFPETLRYKCYCWLVNKFVYFCLQ
jgi:hypothetical protein